MVDEIVPVRTDRQSRMLLTPTALGTVFKYRPLNERTLSILRDRKLYFSSPADFNDPFDCDLRAITFGPLDRLQAVFARCVKKLQKIRDREFLGYIRFLDGQSDPKEDRPLPESRFDPRMNGEIHLLRLILELDEQLKRNPAPDQQHWELTFASFYDRLYQLARTNLGICCLSQDPHNLLMWSHYTNSHEGILLGFDGTDRIFTRRPGISCHEVEYRLDRSVNVAEAGWPGSFVKLFTRKCPDWKYEREIRYVSHTGPGPVTFKRRALRSLVLGLNFGRQFKSDNSRKLVRSLFDIVLAENKARPKGQKLNVYRCVQVQDAFKISLRKVSDLRELITERWS